MKSDEFNDAPPINPPSISTWSNISFAFEGLQLPPYNKEVLLAISRLNLFAIRYLIWACICWAWDDEAVFPVPIAHIGSYAIIIFEKLLIPILKIVSDNCLEITSK